MATSFRWDIIRLTERSSAVPTSSTCVCCRRKSVLSVRGAGRITVVAFAPIMTRTFVISTDIQATTSTARSGPEKVWQLLGIGLTTKFSKTHRLLIVTDGKSLFSQVTDLCMAHTSSRHMRIDSPARFSATATCSHVSCGRRRRHP